MSPDFGASDFGTFWGGTLVRFRSTAALLALSVMMPVSAVKAGTITASYSALGGTNFEHVSMIYAGNSYSFATSKDFGTRSDDGPAGPGVDTLVTHHFVAYCVEIDQNLYIGQSNFHADVLPLLGSTTQLGGAPGSGPVVFDATRTLMMERLWGGFELMAVDKHTAAAFQLAVWEIAFDDDQTLANNGSLLHAPAVDLGDALSAASIAEGWLSQVRDLNIMLDTPSLLLLTDPFVQDLIAVAPAPNIPEPSSLVLALLGAPALAAFIRRRRRRRGR